MILGLVSLIRFYVALVEYKAFEHYFPMDLTTNSSMQSIFLYIYFVILS